MAKRKHFEAMAYAVRGRGMLRYVGHFCVIQTGLMIPPLVTFVSFTGAICLPLYYSAARGRARDLLADRELQTLVVLSLLVSGLLAGSLVLEKGMSVGDETISRYLADMVTGQDVLELSTIVKGDARFFSFTVSEDEAGTNIDDLDLPKQTRVICYYRDGSFYFAKD